MSVKIAQNVFSDGMVCDTNEYVAGQTRSLSNALNATYLSTVGNQGVIQNDMGNIMIKDELENKKNIKLPNGFQPIGMTEYNGIIYIASINKEGECQLGSFPSPNYKEYKVQTIDNIDGSEQEIKMVNSYQPLKNCVKQDVNGQEYFYYQDNTDRDENIKYKIIYDCTTKLFNWDINHPVDIDVQPSYDGSVNLLINDNKNIPRLINTRFSVTSSGTAKIPNRMKNNANLYKIETNQDKFDIDTSLIKRINKFPIIDYEGQVENGNLKVGNYVFYIKYCDYDKNATDWAAESGIISVFKGTDADPYTINSGIEDENSGKTIQLKINNFDRSYDFIKVYYTRSSSEANIEAIPQAFELMDPVYVPENNIISITGNEDIQQIGLDYIQTQYSVIKYAKTQAQIQNYLFFANIKEPDLYYKDLLDLSLHIVPYVKRFPSKEKIGHISQKDYSEDSGITEDSKKHIFKGEYYNTKNIYYNVGYWNEEYYRLGIVYINKDGSNSPVFDLPGGEIGGFENNISNGKINEIQKRSLQLPTNSLILDPIQKNRILFNTKGDYISNSKGEQTDINIRGVIHLNDIWDHHTNNDYIYSLGVKINQEIQEYLTQKLGIKGFFIVRKKRIKTILAQGFTMPWDKESHLPIIEYWAKSFPYTDGDKTMAEAECIKVKMTSFNKNKPIIGETFKKYLENKGGYQSKDDPSMMWFPHYFVESFIAQAGEETRGLSSEDADDVMGDFDFAIERKVTNQYIPRLHNILPCSIDEKMISWKVLDDKTIQNGYNIKGQFVLTKNPGTEALLWPTNFDSFEEAFIQFINGLGSNDPIPNKQSDIYNNLQFIIYRNSIAKSSINILDAASISEKLKEYGIDVNDNTTETYTKLLELKNINNFKFVQKFKLINNLEEYDTFDKALDNGIDSSNSSFKIQFKTLISNDQELNNLLKTKEFTNTNYEITKSTINSVDRKNPDSGYAFSDDSKYYYTSQIQFLNDGSLPILPGATGLYTKDPMFFSYSYYGNYLISDSTTHKGNLESFKTIHWYNRYKYCNGNQLTAICPEFEVNQVDYNQFFTGQELSIKYTPFQQGMPIRSLNNERLYYPVYEYKEDMYQNSKYKSQPYTYNRQYLNKEIKFKIIAVTEELPTVAIDNIIFTSIAGNSQEAYRTSYINEQHSALRHLSFDNNHTSSNDHDFNFVRGIFSPYLGIVASQYSDETNKFITEKERGYSRTFNIYAKGTVLNYDSTKEKDPNLLIRFNDNSAYYPISNRIEFTKKNLNSIEEGVDIFRGDCFLCTFTHRVNRNFQDASSPTNDKILYPATWQENYSSTQAPKDKEGNDKIQKGDINAVKLGSWITIKIKSTNNLSIRTIDESNREEVAIFGHGRKFYPLEPISAEGGQKIPTSYVSNNGFRTNLGIKNFSGFKDKPYIRNEFKNRVLYSNVNNTDLNINGYRVFELGNFRDYSKQYGEITKLIPFGNNLVCIMEHGVGVLAIKERTLMANSTGGDVFINNKTILPENITMINESYGSQWPESVILTPYYIFGIDASEKKIWMTDGSQLKIISDHVISRFLQENIPFKANEYDVNIINSNIKTTYNAKKADVMFTLWNKKENKLWNICYNILTGDFSTFYSWIPSYAANIDSTMYSFEYRKTKDDNEFWKHDNHLWKHGNTKDEYIKPTTWYGETHPFEFEFVVNDYMYVQKIFQNLKMIANDAEPESFHFTISGDNYSFGKDKKNMYYRQEATRELMKQQGSEIEYDDKYNNTELQKQNKSFVFPEYYKKEKPEYYMYEIYKQLTSDGKNYDNLSGTEVTHNKSTDQYNISIHVKNTPIDKENRIRGNSQYKENQWDVQIPSIVFNEKNEKEWEKPPIVLPKSTDQYDIKSTNIEKLPEGYTVENIDTIDTWSERKEAKIRDKYIKIKIRYSGKQLATIYSILTMYQISIA